MIRFVAVLAAVLGLVACGEGSDAGSVEGADGSLDCEVSWTVTDAADVTVVDPGSNIVGTNTPFEAMEFFSARAYGDVDYSIHVVNSRQGTVVMGAQEIMAMTVEELVNERFAVTSAGACGTPFGFIRRPINLGD